MRLIEFFVNCLIGTFTFCSELGSYFQEATKNAFVWIAEFLTNRDCDHCKNFETCCDEFFECANTIHKPNFKRRRWIIWE